ncbi:hypothetical protein [Acinetobacter baumannii]|uniref:hypothetical protein n=1 Tax=Acinetobacter baumannii TaxID=470 RepID=UPI001479B779|nr:hypothetical protein [Acinetobacter baumannii]
MTLFLLKAPEVNQTYDNDYAKEFNVQPKIADWFHKASIRPSIGHKKTSTSCQMN